MFKEKVVLYSEINLGKVTRLSSWWFTIHISLSDIATNHTLGILSFIHPSTKERMTFEVDVDEEFIRVLNEIKENNM